MVLDALDILNYRNIAQAELTFTRGINCLIGRNGMGKTNVLDAIYILSMCKSAVAQTDAALLRHGETLMSVRGLYAHDDGTPETIQLGLRQGSRKIMRRGDKAYQRLSEHIGLIPLVTVSPADAALIASPADRRRLLDVVISQTDPAYLDALVQYGKALQQRNALLRQETDNDELLDLYAHQMAHYGQLIYERRQAYVDAFTPAFQRYHDLLAGGHESVELRYTSHAQRGPLFDVIQGATHKDKAVGYTLHGVHRDDLELTLSGYPLRHEGSQGQTKTFLIALKLSQYEFLRQRGRQTRPILLLDDIFDKLDATRVEKIVELVTGTDFGQTFVTDTNRDHLDQILTRRADDFRLFHVEEGAVR